MIYVTHSDKITKSYLRLLLITLNRLILSVTGAIISLISLCFIICQFGNYLNSFETKSNKHFKSTLVKHILLPLLHKTNTWHVHTFTQNHEKKLMECKMSWSRLVKKWGCYFDFSQHIWTSFRQWHKFSITYFHKNYFQVALEIWSETKEELSDYFKERQYKFNLFVLLKPREPWLL